MALFGKDKAADPLSLMKAGKYKEAVKALEKKLKQNPNDFQTKMRLAEAFEGAGRKDDAVKIYSQEGESSIAGGHRTAGLALLKKAQKLVPGDGALNARIAAIENVGTAGGGSGTFSFDIDMGEEGPETEAVAVMVEFSPDSAQDEVAQDQGEGASAEIEVVVVETAEMAGASPPASGPAGSPPSAGAREVPAEPLPQAAEAVAEPVTQAPEIPSEPFPQAPEAVAEEPAVDLSGELPAEDGRAVAEVEFPVEFEMEAPEPAVAPPSTEAQAAGAASSVPAEEQVVPPPPESPKPAEAPISQPPPEKDGFIPAKEPPKPSPPGPVHPPMLPVPTEEEIFEASAEMEIPAEDMAPEEPAAEAEDAWIVESHSEAALSVPAVAEEVPQEPEPEILPEPAEAIPAVVEEILPEPEPEVFPEPAEVVPAAAEEILPEPEPEVFPEPAEVIPAVFEEELEVLEAPVFGEPAETIEEIPLDLQEPIIAAEDMGEGDLVSGVGELAVEAAVQEGAPEPAGELPNEFAPVPLEVPAEEDVSWSDASEDEVIEVAEDAPVDTGPLSGQEPLEEAAAVSDGIPPTEEIPGLALPPDDTPAPGSEELSPVFSASHTDEFALLSGGSPEAAEEVAELPSEELQPPSEEEAGGAQASRLLMADDTQALMRELFPGLDPEGACRLSAALKRITLQAGEVLIREGEAGDSLFLVMGGALEASGRFHTQNLRLAMLRRCDVIGEVAFLKNVPRTATVIALEPSTVLELSREAASLHFGDRPELLSRLEAILEERVLSTIQTLRRTSEEE